MLNSTSNKYNPAFGAGAIQIPNFELNYAKHMDLKSNILKSVRELGGKPTLTSSAPNGSVSEFVGNSLEHEKRIAQTVEMKYSVKTIVDNKISKAIEFMQQELGASKQRASKEEVNEFFNTVLKSDFDAFGKDKGLGTKKQNNDLNINLN